MLIKDIGKKWLVCNYNYVSLLDKNNHDSEYSVREYYKSIMKTYAESSNTSVVRLGEVCFMDRYD